MASMAGDRPEGWQEAARLLTESLASTEPAPGGGAAAAVSGAMGCALAAMSLGVSAASRKCEASRRAWLLEARADFELRRIALLRLAAEDAAAFRRVMEAYSLDRGDPARPGRLQSALEEAARAPLDTALAAAQALAKALEARSKTLGTVSSDMACAALLLRAGGLCALENVEVNAALMTDSGSARSLRDRALRARDALAEGR